MCAYVCIYIYIHRSIGIGIGTSLGPGSCIGITNRRRYKGVASGVNIMIGMPTQTCIKINAHSLCVLTCGQGRGITVLRLQVSGLGLRISSLPDPRPLNPWGFWV